MPAAVHGVALPAALRKGCSQRLGAVTRSVDGPRVVQCTFLKSVSSPSLSFLDHVLTSWQVFVKYIGKLKKNGKVFDSNQSGRGFKFRLGGWNPKPLCASGLAGHPCMCTTVLVNVQYCTVVNQGAFLPRIQNVRWGKHRAMRACNAFLWPHFLVCMCCQARRIQ